MTLPSYAYIAEIIETNIQLPTTRPTRSGIRMFLMLAANEQRQYLCPPSSPAWMKLWRQIQWARGMARALHIEIPAKFWAEDQARLAAKLTQPEYGDISILSSAEKERALRWTRKRSQSS